MAQPETALRSSVRHVEDIPAVLCGGLFPLTPALSLGERVNPSRRGVQSRPFGLHCAGARCSLSLRERVRVRENGAFARARTRDAGWKTRYPPLHFPLRGSVVMYPMGDWSLFGVFLVAPRRNRKSTQQTWSYL